MRLKHPLLALGLIAALAVPAAAQPSVLDLVPSDQALAAIVVRNLDELSKKGDKFVEDTDLKGLGPLRPSELFKMAYATLGIDRGGVDETKSAGILLLRPEKEGDEIGLANLEQLIVGVIPIKDLDKLADSFRVKADQLKPGRIVQGNGNVFGKQFAVHGKHLLLSNSEKSVKRVLEGKSLAKEVDEAQRKSLQEADILVHFAPKGLGKEWKHTLEEIEREFVKGEDPAEDKVLKQFLESLDSLRFATAGIRLDNGLGVNVVASFPKQGPAADFLKTLRPKSHATLKGLPEGNVIAAHANVSDASKNVLLARLVLKLLFKNILETQQIVSATDRPNFVGVFTEIWQRLQGSRLAVYLSRDESKQGLFSLVAILDADDAKKFLGDMRTLARIADGSILDLGKKQAEEKIDFDALIRDLGNKTYRVREAATTRLRLIGEPALAHLRAAIKRNSDLELVRRAEQLEAQITRVAAERRKELLSKDLPKFVRPTFAFVPRAEKRAGYDVHIVKIKLADKDIPVSRQMKQLLGPEWDRLRLAVHENQIVVLLGSEAELLDAALANLKAGKPGLAAAKQLATFTRQANPNRVMEFHLSVEKFLGLTNAQKGSLTGGGVSSFAVTVEPDRLQLDLFLPTSEVRRVVKANPF